MSNKNSKQDHHKKLDEQIETLLNTLEKISVFTKEEDESISQKTDNLVKRSQLNKKKAEEYQKLEKSKPFSKQSISLMRDVLNENIQIHEQKMELTGIFINDIYSRFKKLQLSLVPVIKTTRLLLSDMSYKKD